MTPDSGARPEAAGTSYLLTRAVALLLTVLTGFSGLVYEVTWQKCLATLLGSHSEATSAVLGIYLGGLAVGYAVFGRVTARLIARAERTGQPPRLLLTYGFVEGSIGLWALAFPTLFGLVQHASLALPHTHQSVAFAVDVAWTALLIGPPTVMMGGTIPLLTQALARSLDDSARVHAFVYAFNTAGAFLGALAAGFVLIAWLGLAGVLYAMGTVNLVAGSVFVLLGTFGRSPAAAAVAGAPPVAAPRVEGFASYALVAGLLGFAMMSTQTVVIRLGGLALGSSHFTFSMVVAVFVLCIALGGFAVSAMPRIRPGHLYGAVWTLAGLLTLLYLALDTMPYWAWIIRSWFRNEDLSFYPYYGAAFLALLAVLGLPVAISGATLPLLFGHLQNQIGELGTLAGRLYSWNTVGNLAGALLGGYALLFWLDLHAVYRVGVGAVLVAATILSFRLSPRLSDPRVAAAVGLVAVALLGALPEWSPVRLSAGTFRRREPSAEGLKPPGEFFSVYERGARMDFYTDDPTNSIAVKATPEDGKMARAVYNNGKSDGSLGGDYPTMSLIAHIPCMLAGSCRSAFVVGYGTGVSAGELASLDSMERVLVAEISRGVIQAAPLFEHGNRAPLRSGKVEVIRSDAYRALLRSDERFDVICSEPSNPWTSGVEMLFAREFLTAARDRLNPGGLYAQWMHLYETDDATVELVLRTYRSVFDRVSVWFTWGPDILLIGHPDDDEGPDLAEIERRFARRDLRSGLRRSGIEGLPAFFAHEVLPAGSIRLREGDGELHTLLHPLLSHRAARAFFRGARASLTEIAFPRLENAAGGGPWLARWIEAQGGADALDESTWESIVREGCEFEPFCPTLLARWGLAQPESSARQALLAELRHRPIWQRDASPARLARLQKLYGDGSALPKSLSVQAAEEWTRLYADGYHAAFPFSREVLTRIWERCRSSSGACQAARSKARARIGEF
jgi:predicted membrane-bound spermidine synthase